MRYELIPAKPGVPYGYINLTRDGPAGLVCSSYAGNDEASNLCRAAGFRYGGMLFPFVLDPPAPTNVWRAHLYCGNQNQDIEGCVSDRWQFGPSVLSNNSDGKMMGFDCDSTHGHLVKVFCFDKPGKKWEGE